MTTHADEIRTVLQDAEGWAIQARKQMASLALLRAEVLKRAAKLKVTAAVKGVCAWPKPPGAEAAQPEAPAAYPTGANSSVEQQRQFQEKLDPLPHQSGPLAVPAELRRK